MVMPTTKKMRSGLGAFVVLFTTVIWPSSTTARLDETQIKIVARYGEPVDVYRDVKGRTGYIHHSGGYLIMVQYIDGISQDEVYAKEDDAELTQLEIDSILAANAQGRNGSEYLRRFRGAT